MTGQEAVTGDRARVPYESLLLLAPLFILASGLSIVSDPSLAWLTTWGTTIVFLIGMVLCGWRAREGGPIGRTWRWFTLACALWASGNLYYALAISPGVLPIPSPADIGYFFFPWAMGAGLLSHVRHRVGTVPADALLDGLIAGLTIAALGAAVIDQLAGTDVHNVGALITTVMYPLEDAAVLGLVVGIVSVLGWRPGRVVVVLAAAIVLITLSDIGAFASVVASGRIGGAFINAGWAAAVVLFTVAARLDDGSVAALARRTGEAVQLPVVFFVLAVLLLAFGGALSLGVVTTTLAALALAACAVRLWRAFREIRALAESRALALTDELTGLANRRRLLYDLRRACSDGDRCRLAIFDLDGFKAFNDRFGHPDGDRLLSVLAQRLEHAVSGHGRAYRLGGDEFCVLLDASATADTIDRAEAALRDDGVGWSVGASFGVAAIPDEATTPSTAMQLADRRMYAQKDRRPLAARQQARDVLLSALGEQQPELHAHTQDVTELAGAVARRLNMTPEQVDDVIRAAELHDIGKLAIPREILEKPGPLDEQEWAVMRRHTLIGARMLVVAPALHTVAPLVRSSHERWDGRGYPDQLTAEEIPLGARIVSVCDAFDAMVADRVYRPGMPMSDAVAELRACAGTQFDPQVVEAFLAVVSLPDDGD